MNTVDETFVIANPRLRWRRWLKRIGCGLLLSLILAICARTWLEFSAQQRLDEATAELDRSDPVWRLKDIEAAREQIPERENSARVAVAASKLLPQEWPEPELKELFSNLPPEEQLTVDQYATLKEELDDFWPALQEARELVNMPRGRHRLEIKTLVLDTVLNDQQATRRVVNLLCYDALRHGQEQDMISALNSCQSAFHTARSLGDEPFAISQLVRMAEVMQSCQSLERVMAQGEPPSERLAKLQELFRDEDDFPDFLVFARGERASLHETFTAIESGEVPLTHSFFGPRPSWEEYVLGRYHRYRFRQAHPTMLTVMSRFVTIAQLPMYKQANAQTTLDREIGRLKDSNPLAVLFVPALRMVFDASRRKHAYLRSTMVALAAERYRRSHDAWPESPDKLCPKYLSAVPLDPFDGQKLRYCRLEDGLVMYSVGPDEVDNNGNLYREFRNPSGVDIGVRLWDVAKRRQPPRPKEQQEDKPR